MFGVQSGMPYYVATISMTLGLAAGKGHTATVQIPYWTAEIWRSKYG